MSRGNSGAFFGNSVFLFKIKFARDGEWIKHMMGRVADGLEWPAGAECWMRVRMCKIPGGASAFAKPLKVCFRTALWESVGERQNGFYKKVGFKVSLMPCKIRFRAEIPRTLQIITHVQNPQAGRRNFGHPRGLSLRRLAGVGGGGAYAATFLRSDSRPWGSFGFGGVCFLPAFPGPDFFSTVL